MQGAPRGAAGSIEAARSALQLAVQQAVLTVQGAPRGPAAGSIEAARSARQSSAMSPTIRQAP
jgi:hypothetical protein